MFDKTYTIQLDQNKSVEELIVMLSNEHIEFDEVTISGGRLNH